MRELKIEIILPGNVKKRKVGRRIWMKSKKKPMTLGESSGSEVLLIDTSV